MSRITPNDYPHRFSWPMRLFLGAFLFDMVAHAVLIPLDAGVDFEEHVQSHPKPLPTERERRLIAAGKHPDGYTSYSDRLMASVRSLPEYFTPWPPGEKVESHIESSWDIPLYLASWYLSRADFLTHLVGIDQNWTMFSPNVGTTETMGRCRLVYADGSDRIIRPLCDPKDLCRYSHWFEEKHLQVALKIHRDRDTRLGYCKWLAKRYPQNANGSPLVRIEVFKIHYSYPGVDDDPDTFLRQQSGPPAEQVDEPFWQYHVDEERGEYY